MTNTSGRATWGNQYADSSDSKLMSIVVSTICHIMSVQNAPFAETMSFDQKVPDPE